MLIKLINALTYIFDAIGNLFYYTPIDYNKEKYKYYTRKRK